MKIIAFFVAFIFVFNSYSQTKILSYKSKTDSVVAKYFGKSFLLRSECTGVSIDGFNRSLYFSNWKSAEFDEKLYSNITLFYSCIEYSEVSKYRLGFEITLDKKMNIQYDSILFLKIPECLSNSFNNCGFINMDDAVSIALKNTAHSNEYLQVYFEKFGSENCYWFVCRNPKLTDENWPPVSISEEQSKIINAKTGENISWEKFDSPKCIR